MKTRVTRRDVLRFAGGAAAGVMLSPVPWKLTDDLAIWTQNWSWIPVPPKGEETARLTSCSLCPAGCAVRARCIGGQPVSLHAVPADPVSGGALCALGLTGHHLPYHPARVTSPLRAVGPDGARRWLPVRPEAVLAETARAIATAAGGAGSVAVLDLRPGRSVSWAWRRLLAGIPGSAVVPAPGLAGASLATLERMAGRESGSIGFDLGAARTVVSFGAPLADGWGEPGRAASVLRRRGSGRRLVQVEPVRSRTAELADRWLPCRPGTEAALALALGHVLVSQRLFDPAVVTRAGDFAAYTEMAARLAPEAAAAMTGVPAELIVATAREMAAHGPAVAVAGEDAGGGRLGEAAETAIWALDLLLGAAGRSGTLVRRADLPAPAPEGELAPLRDIEEIPDRSVAVLLVDASAGDAAFPWPVVERKLRRNGAVVVALSPFRTGTASRAGLMVPTAPFPEAFQELPTGFDAPRAALAVSTPLLPPRVGSVDPVAFVRDLAGALGRPLDGGWTTTEELVRARAARIRELGRGSVTGPSDDKAVGVSEFPTSDAMWKVLASGGRWRDDPLPLALDGELRLLGDAARDLAEIAPGSGSAAVANARLPLVLVPRGERDVTASAAVSPVMTKLYRESSLRRAPGAGLSSRPPPGRCG